MHTLASSPPEITDGIALPLTYDEADYHGLLSWVRLGTGPHVTPEGMIGNGYDARYRATHLPAWLAAGSSQPLTIHASARVSHGARNTTLDVIVAACANDSSAYPKLGLCVRDDTLAGEGAPNICAYARTSGGTQFLPLARNTWKYELRYPELEVGGKKARPQGVFFEDSNTILLAVHYEDEVCRMHRVRLSDGAILGWFDFDLSEHPAHINAITQASDGTCWVSGSGRMVQIDLAASFASHAVVETCSYSISSAGAAFIDIATISGVEYVLCGSYLESGTPYLYVFPYSLVEDGGTFQTSDRTVRYVINQRTQGIEFHDGKLYTTMNRRTSSSAVGLIHRLTINPATDADDTSLVTPEAEWYAPSQYPEDLAFHPVTGHLWTATEGLTSVGSHNGWLALWSMPLDGSPVENHYTLHYDGAGSVSIRVNNRDFQSVSWTPNVTPECVSVGGPPAATAGIRAGFFLGVVRNVVIQEAPLSAAGYKSAVTGVYEPNALQVFHVPLTNPGAEAGDASGWMDEVGGLAVRTTDPAPHSGSYYFMGGTNLQTIARQRISLEDLTGLTEEELDESTMWARSDWWQSSFDGASDPGSVGLRFAASGGESVVERYAGIATTDPSHTWLPRGAALAKPLNARSVDALIRADRSAGTNNDAYFDDISLVVYRQASGPLAPVLDLDARFVETSGSSVTLWPDLSLMSNHASPISASPTVESNIFGTLPGVKFTAASLNALNIASSLVLGDGPRHVFVIYKPDASSTQNGYPLWMGGESGVEGAYFSIVSRSDDDPRLQAGAPVGGSGIGFAGFGHGTRVPGVALLADAYHDGAENGLGKNGGTPLTASGSLVTPSDGTIIGTRRGGGASMMFVGHIGCVRVYPRRLSAEERAQVCASLMSTWGVTP